MEDEKIAHDVNINRFCPVCGYEGDDLLCPVCNEKTESLDVEIDKVAELENKPSDIFDDESIEEVEEKELTKDNNDKPEED